VQRRVFYKSRGLGKNYFRLGVGSSDVSTESDYLIPRDLKGASAIRSLAVTGGLAGDVLNEEVG